MALNHTNPGAQPRESRAQPVAPKRTTPGPQHRQYSGESRPRYEPVTGGAANLRVATNQGVLEQASGRYEKVRSVG